MIDRERMVDDLRTMIRIPSITGSEEAVATWAADALRELGLAVETSAPDLASVRADPAWPGEEMPRTSLPVVIGRAGPAGGRRIVLSGHLDVVPPGDLSTWTTDPWAGDIRDSAIYGRGACDMKGGVASILARSARSARQATCNTWPASCSWPSCRPRRTVARARWRRSGPAQPGTWRSSPSPPTSTS